MAMWGTNRHLRPNKNIPVVTVTLPILNISTKFQLYHFLLSYNVVQTWNSAVHEQMTKLIFEIGIFLDNKIILK